MKRFFSATLFTLFVSWTASAEPPILTETNALLTRVNASDLNPGLRLTVDLAGDIPKETHVIARFQNNQPQQRTPSGIWVNWDEQYHSLIDNGFTPKDDGTITFELVSRDLVGTFLPAVFTISYRTELGLKSGHVVIDQ